MKNNQSGRSMVEMLGVLAIIGVLSAGGLAGYSKAMFKHKLNSTMDQITMLVTNIRTMYGTQGNYDGLNNQTAVNLGIVPAVMGTGASLTNPFKGDVTIAVSSTKGDAETAPANSAFTLKYEGLPSEACIALATADFGSGAGSGFIGVDIAAASTAVVGTGAGSGQDVRAEGKAYEMSKAITACKDSQSNTIIWKFY